ncbi:helix-turn-helix domain-containing protein, partial [Leekyejoonella antrihumi]
MRPAILDVRGGRGAGRDRGRCWSSSRAGEREGHLMGWASPMGRPAGLTEDRTPLRGRTIDARARIAWLLRVHRLSAGYASAAAFTTALAAHDCHLAPPTISRYETGTVRVPDPVFRAYEQALGLPAGYLMGVCAGMDRMVAPVSAAASASGGGHRFGSVCDRLLVGRFGGVYLPSQWLVSCQKSAKNPASPARSLCTG